MKLAQQKLQGKSTIIFIGYKSPAMHQNRYRRVQSNN